MPDYPVFRADIADIAEIIGDEAAWRLARAFGGCKLYVPQSVSDTHPIAAAIGPALAARFCAQWHGSWFYFPIAVSRRRRIQELAAAGQSPSSIAREVFVSERYVYAVLAESRASEQLEMFDTGYFRSGAVKTPLQ